MGTSSLEAGNDRCTGVLGVARRLVQDGSDHSRPEKVASRHRMLGMVACDVPVLQHQHSWFDRLPLGTKTLPSAPHRNLFSMGKRIVTDSARNCLVFRSSPLRTRLLRSGASNYLIWRYRFDTKFDIAKVLKSMTRKRVVFEYK